MRHTFVICAYKESEFLDQLTGSLLNQSVKSKVIIATSTPNDKIRLVAEKYGVELRENPVSSGSASDWNFAYKQADTEFVTLAHQDDVYERTFVEAALDAFSKKKNPILAFTDYYEIRDGRRVENNRLLSIKRIMLKPVAMAGGSRFVRNRVLSLGFPICCPSITYNKRRFPEINFLARFKNSLDWEAICRLAREAGEFVYIRRTLVGHRIYQGSQTTNMIRSGERYAEDLEILSKYWPISIAKCIMKLYAKSMESNAVSGR
jgi:glycosyltransferase involved in cell wall biosynthesis